MAARNHSVGIDHLTVVPKPAVEADEPDVEPESVARADDENDEN